MSLWTDWVASKSPQAWYRQGEGSGTTLVDSSGNSRDGTYTGSPTLGVASLVRNDTSNNCVTYSGTGQYADVTHAAWMDTADATYMVWIQRTGTTDMFIGGRNSGSSSTSYMFLDTNSTNIRCYATRSSGTQVLLSAADNYHDGLPHLVAGVANSATNTLKLYVDGVEVATSSSLTSGLRTASTPNLTIARRTGTSTLWAGQLDEFLAFNTALSAADILAGYQAGMSSVGSGSLTLSGSGTAVDSTASGTGSITLSGTGTAVDSTATGTGSITLSATGSATQAGAASGTGSLTLTSSGTAEVAATGTGSITLSGSGMGVADVSGTGSLTLTGSGSAGIGVTGTGHIDLTGTGGAGIGTSGTGHIDLTGIGTAGEPIPETHYPAPVIECCQPVMTRRRAA